MDFEQWATKQLQSAPNLYTPPQHDGPSFKRMQSGRAFRFYLDSAAHGTVTVYISAFEDRPATLDSELYRLCQQNDGKHYKINKDGVFETEK